MGSEHRRIAVVVGCAVAGKPREGLYCGERTQHAMIRETIEATVEWVTMNV